MSNIPPENKKKSQEIHAKIYDFVKESRKNCTMCKGVGYLDQRCSRGGGYTRYPCFQCN